MASLRNNDLFANLPPPAECLAILLGCAETFAFGLAGLGSPIDFAKGYGLPIEAPEKDAQPTKTQQTQAALIQAIAARNLQTGVLIFTFACYLRDRRALGVVISSCFITTVADTLIVKSYGVQDAVAGHVVGMFNTALIGGSLLYWGRSDPYW